jgi:hypothetical protein
MSDLFNSFNVHESLEAVTAKSPDELVAKLKEIRTPIKILEFVADGGRHTAYIMGDIRKKKIKES